MDKLQCQIAAMHTRVEEIQQEQICEGNSYDDLKKIRMPRY